MNVPDVSFTFCGYHIYDNMSIFICRMLCKLTAIFIWKVFEKIRQVKSSTLFSKLSLATAGCYKHTDDCESFLFVFTVQQHHLKTIKYGF